MILYCTVCYLIMFGILVDQNKSFDDLKYQDLVISLLAPLIVPIIIGMRINNKSNEK